MSTRDVIGERIDKGIYGGTATSDHPEPEPVRKPADALPKGTQ